MTRKHHRHLEQHEGEFMTHSFVYVLVNYCFNHRIAPLFLFISFLFIMMFTSWDLCVFVRSLLANMLDGDGFIKVYWLPLRKDGKRETERERRGKIKWCWHTVSDIVLRRWDIWISGSITMMISNMVAVGESDTRLLAVISCVDLSSFAMLLCLYVKEQTSDSQHKV